jgi:nicotinate-nucleotide pyrophosphorylase (carboxylating)
MILLDNFSLDMMREASRISRPRHSRSLRQRHAGNHPRHRRNRRRPHFGGRLTKDVKALDLSMRFVG